MTEQIDKYLESFSDNELVETKIDGSIVYSGSFFQIEKDRVRLPDKKIATREFIRHPGAAVVIPLFDDGRVLLERQFRYPMGRIFIEFPAGKIDKGETSFKALLKNFL